MLADILSRAQPLPDQANLLHERKALVLLPPTGAVAKCRNTDLTTAVRGPQLAPTDVDVHWRYDERWRAQPILDHVFLGPSAAARDVKFLRRANITLLLGIRDQRLARAQALGAAAERAAAQVREVYRHLWHQTESSVKARTSAGDESSHREGEGEANWWCQLPIVKYIDVVGPGPRFGNSHANSVDDAEPLVRALPSALDIINEHLAKAATSLSPSFLMADDEESQDNNDNGNGTNEKQQDVHEHDILYDYHPPQDPPGRVLVFCENGNGLSAVLVAAYLIASWGLSVSRACQWVSLRRFCATFTEPEKRVLLTFEDLLVARRQVEAAAAAAEAGGSDGDGIGHASAFSGTQTDHSVRTDPARARSEGGARMQKRGIEETRDDDEMVDCAMAMDVDGGAPDYATLAMDRDRFVGRDRHVPFIDIDPLGNMCGL